MEDMSGLQISKKAVTIASGVAVASLGAYMLYRLLSSGADDSITNEKKSEISCNRQPSENVDTTEEMTGKKVLVLGMEKSGKTCLLAALTNEETEKEYQPTLGFNVVCITNTEKRLDIMEVGGSAQYREYWGKFVGDTSVLLYVIDSSRIEVISNTLEALKEVLSLKELLDTPVVIVFSKRDDSTATSIEQMIELVEKEQFENRKFEYANTQVKCGGAPNTEGVVQLQERLSQLC